MTAIWDPQTCQSPASSQAYGAASKPLLLGGNVTMIAKRSAAMMSNLCLSCRPARPTGTDSDADHTMASDYCVKFDCCWTEEVVDV